MTNERKPLFVDGILDTTALTRREFNFLVQVIDRQKVTPMLDQELGPRSEMFKHFAKAGLLRSKGDYIGGGDSMTTYWMDPNYIPFFGTSPEEFAEDPEGDAPLNTRDLIGAMEIIYLRTDPHENGLGGYRIKIDKVERRKTIGVPAGGETYSYLLLGEYPAKPFTIRGDWNFPDQEVEFRDDGTIEAKDQDGTPYILEFKYVAPVTRDIVDKLLDGRLGWKHDNTLTS